MSGDTANGDTANGTTANGDTANGTTINGDTCTANGDKECFTLFGKKIDKCYDTIMLEHK